MSKRKPLIAIVDDDESVRETTKGLMRSMGFSAEAFGSAGDFLDSAHLSRTECLVADVNMPGMSGLDLHQHLAAAGKAIPTILITAYPNERVRTLAFFGAGRLLENVEYDLAGTPCEAVARGKVSVSLPGRPDFESVRWAVPTGRV